MPQWTLCLLLMAVIRTEASYSSQHSPSALLKWRPRDSTRRDFKGLLWAEDYKQVLTFISHRYTWHSRSDPWESNYWDSGIHSWQVNTLQRRNARLDPGSTTHCSESVQEVVDRPSFYGGKWDTGFRLWKFPSERCSDMFYKKKKQFSVAF